MFGKIKKNQIVVIAIILVLVVLLSCLTIIMVRKSKQKSIVNNMFAEIKTGNANNIAKYIQNDMIASMEENDEKTSGNEELKILLEKMEYKVGNVKKKDDKYIVSAKVSNKDIQNTLKNYFSTAFAEMLKNISRNVEEEDIETKLNEYLKTEYENSDIITTEIEITLIKEDGSWKVERSEENGNRILNAILPGYLQYVSESELGN